MTTIRVGHARDWMGLIRLSHTVFALPFAALATVLALATPLATGKTAGALPAFRIVDVVGILSCMVFARSAAMAFNRLVDHRFDLENPRTATRHLPAGVLSRGQVSWFTLTCGVLFVASTLLFLPNRLPLLASVPVLLFLLGYSFAKRFTWAAHAWLGVALSLSPLCAWVAIRGGEVVANPADLTVPAILAVAIALWVTGFDIIYACQDETHDRHVGLRSIPARFGAAGAFRIAAACHVAMLGVLGLLAVLGGRSGIGLPFAIATAVVALLVLRQHRLVRPGDLDRINQAFFNTNAAISVILLLAGTYDALWAG